MMALQIEYHYSKGKVRIAEISEKECTLFFNNICDIYEQETGVMIDLYGDTRLYFSQFEKLLEVWRSKKQIFEMYNSKYAIIKKHTDQIMVKDGLFILIGD